MAKPSGLGPEFWEFDSPRGHVQKVGREEFAATVASSNSVMGVLERLGYRKAGGTHAHLSRRIKLEGYDTAHFTGQGHNKGRSALSRKTPSEILVILPAGSARPEAYQLRRALIESGRPYECVCGNAGVWHGLPLVLEVDHIDGDWLNNRIGNLRFLCPNCHAQQVTTNRPHKLGVA